MEAKQIEEMVTRIVGAMSKTIMDSVSKIMSETRQAFTECLEKHQDATAHDLFELKSKNEELAKKIAALEHQQKQYSAVLWDTTNKMRSNRHFCMTLEQKHYKNDVTIITNTETPPTIEKPHKMQRPNKDRNGYFFHTATFNDLNDKIAFLKNRKQNGIKAFPVLCPSRRQLLEKARAMVESGKITKAYTYKDVVYVEYGNGKRTALDTEDDLVQFQGQ